MGGYFLGLSRVIYKTGNTGTGIGMGGFREMQGARGMFTRIPDNFLRGI